MTPPPRAGDPQSVFVVFDGTPQATATYPLAGVIVQISGGTLHVVVPSAKDLSAPEIEHRRSLLTRAASGAVVHERAGDVESSLLELATCSSHAIVVLPTYGDARPDSGLGVLQEEVLRRLNGPIILVPPQVARASWTPDRILFPQDGSVGNARSLCPVAPWAARVRAEVLVLHISSDTPGAPEAGTLRIPAYVDQPQHEWPSWVAMFLERVRQQCDLGPEVLLRFQWGFGEPGEAIVRAAYQSQADLIVMSWKGCFEEGRAQVLRRVLRDSPCPVLVFRACSLPGTESR